MPWHTCAVQFRGQLIGVSTVLLPCAAQEQNSGHCAWWQPPFPEDEPSHRPFSTSSCVLHSLPVTLGLIHISNLLKKLFLYSETDYFSKYAFSGALLNNQENRKFQVSFTVISGSKHSKSREHAAQLPCRAQVV